MEPTQLGLRQTANKPVALGICMLIAVVLVLGVGGSPTWGETGVTDSEIVIGSCSALEGPSSFLGTQTVLGAKAYLSYVNDQGGVAGRKIRLVSYDDSYDPAKASDCWNRLVQDQVFADAFFVGTPTAVEYAPLAEAAKIPIVGLFTGAQFLREPFKRYIINVRASYYDETREQIENVWNALGVRQIGVIYQDDAFGKTVLDGVKLALGRHNAAPAALGTFTRGSVEVTPAIQQVRAASPNAVVVVGPYRPVAEIVKQAHASGWSPLFLTVSFVGTEAFIQAAGKDAEGTVITQVVPPYTRTDLPGVALYLKAIKQYYPDAQPNFVSLEGFVDAMVLLEGIKRAGKDLTREKLIAAVESIHSLDLGLGHTMRLSYSPTNHSGFSAVYATVVRGGQAVVLANWKNLKTGP